MPQAIPARGSLLQIEDAIIDGAGTAAATGTAVTGTATAFDTEAAVGDLLVIPIAGVTEARIITVITSAISATINSAFSSDPADGAFELASMSSILFVESITGPDFQADVIEVTNLLDVFKGKVAGNVDPGEQSATIWWQAQNANHQALFVNLKGSFTRYLLAWDPDASSGILAKPPPDIENSVFLSRGIVTGLSKSANAGEAVQANLTITLTGESFLYPGA